MSTTTLLYGIFVCRRIIRYKVVLCHGGTFGGTARLHGLACHDPDYINAPADLPVRTALQRRGRLARPPSRPVHAFAPAYNAEDNLLVRTGSQTPWLVYLSAPTADSPVKGSSFT